MKVLRVALVFMLSASAYSDIIGLSDFGAAQYYDDFRDTSIDGYTLLSTPFEYNGHTYRTGSGEMEYSYFRTYSCGFWLHSDGDYLEIELSEPVARAGVAVGLWLHPPPFVYWSGSVEFYDMAGILLGETVCSNVFGYEFVGWDEDSNLINSILIRDAPLDDATLQLDALVTEMIIPEPSSLFLLLLGLAMILILSQRAQPAPSPYSSPGAGSESGEA